MATFIAIITAPFWVPALWYLAVRMWPYWATLAIVLTTLSILEV
jgi:hypothetical protein